MRNRHGKLWARTLSAACLLGVAGAALLSFSAQPAEAGRSKYAAFVVDAKTGKTLYARNADAYRYPASLTKIMTLYVLFEEMAAKRLSYSSRLKVSRFATAQQPSKLGLKRGSTIRVRDAIRALVTKSANDVAVVVAESISGSQPAFARRMTRTARELGMKRTTFRNASGLPDTRQRTTARDMARLGRAIQDRFPGYYKHFKLRVFSYRGRRYSNHNRLLGRVRGVDGIKTGYTRASGFNLVTSVKRGKRHIVAVVMGGRTGRARNAKMRRLIARNLGKASRGRRTAPLILTARAKKARRRSISRRIPIPRRRPDNRLLTASITKPVLASKGTKIYTARVTPTARPAGKPHRSTSGWMIQIGAVPSHWAAIELLNSARSNANNILKSRSPYTQTIVKNRETLFRVRFAGFQSRGSASLACKALKKKNFPCFTVYQ